MHIGPKPGTVYEESLGDGKMYMVKISRNFVTHIINIKDGNLLDQYGSEHE